MLSAITCRYAAKQFPPRRAWLGDRPRSRGGTHRTFPLVFLFLRQPLWLRLGPAPIPTRGERPLSVEPRPVRGAPRCHAEVEIARLVVRGGPNGKGDGVGQMRSVADFGLAAGTSAPFEVRISAGRTTRLWGAVFPTLLTSHL